MKSIGMVALECVREGKETIEIRYYLSSLDVKVKQFAHAVRSHWSIENSCPWSLDMTYREDESRLREKQVRENLAWLNLLTLSLLKQHRGRERIVMKRRSGGWNENFLLEVLAGATPSCALALVMVLFCDSVVVLHKESGWAAGSSIGTRSYRASIGYF